MDMKEKLAAVIRAAAERGIADGVFPEAEIPAVEEFCSKGAARLYTRRTTRETRA